MEVHHGGEFKNVPSEVIRGVPFEKGLVFCKSDKDCVFMVRTLPPKRLAEVHMVHSGKELKLFPLEEKLVNMLKWAATLILRAVLSRKKQQIMCLKLMRKILKTQPKVNEGNSESQPKSTKGNIDGVGEQEAAING
ncbi:hypothetical protein ACH5RR_001125 [Cinchona calisaya]|uniref:Uncharacterized protein n=1 Tax=Cinchona calisaya TaxID=153742 RepID=A0ABD3B2S1_9GENT